MEIYKKILVAADLVEADDHPVLTKAKAMQQMTGATLFLCHVLSEAPTISQSIEIAEVTDWEKEMEEVTKERLKKICLDMEIPEERCQLRSGQPSEVILEVAQAIGADLIILGSHARHGLGLLFLGSTANGVLHYTKCDVLAVRV